MSFSSSLSATNRKECSGNIFFGKVEIKEAQPSPAAIFFGGASDWTGKLSEKIDFRDVAGLGEGYIVMCTRAGGSAALYSFAPRGRGGGISRPGVRTWLVLAGIDNREKRRNAA